jgi:hypothetical protein
LQQQGVSLAGLQGRRGFDDDVGDVWIAQMNSASRDAEFVQFSGSLRKQLWKALNRKCFRVFTGGCNGIDGVGRENQVVTGVVAPMAPNLANGDPRAHGRNGRVWSKRSNLFHKTTAMS